ncbi:MYB and hsa domain protein [Colletotrichum higginsianum]|nr:MYB and hsa domain protein [Colletotrichum higginsianum]
MDSAQTGVAVKVPPSQLTPMTATPKSPTRPKVFANKKKEKEKAKNKPSAVVFGKQTKRSVDKSLMPSQQKQSFLPTDDYFTPLFVQGFTQTSKWMKPIEVVLNQSHKTVSTPDAYVAIQDNQACRVLRRVYHLQQHDKWSLRQPKRCPEPVRPESHWDVLLHEMKWMRTDFREEKKWRLAAARNLAHACAEWVASTEDERKELQVSSYIPPLPQPADAEADISMAETAMDVVDAQATPELVPSGDQDSPEHVDELQEEAIETVAPSAIFALEEDDVVFELRSSPATDQLLQELPMYGTPLKVPAFDFTGPEFDPDAHWRRPALPLSKYVEGEMKLSSDGPPRKRSRYQYEEEEDDDDERVVFGSQPAKKMKLPPQNTDVALFNPEMKPIRDRLHAGHQFRPPAEYQMPMQNFYECRSPSQWTLSEDDELRSLVREYSYNWSLISSLLTPRSLFNSGAERRTPWECFERWINLEGLPTDMQKTQYFKAYQNRIDAANRVIMQQNQIAQQQAAGSTTPATPVARRRPSTPLRVERRRNQKHLTLIDAMRKLAKKRETAAQKQQHATQMAAMRKANEAAQPRGPTKTPRDYSLMRWERDQQLAEKVAQFHRRQEDQRRIAMQARQGQVAAQIATTPGAGQAQTNAAAQVNGTIPRPNMPNQLAVPGQAGRGRMPVQAPTANMGGVPAQMGGLVPPAMQMNGQNIYANAQALMASVNSANGVGVSTPPAGGLHMPNGTAGSPRPLTQVPASIQVQLNNLENQYRAKNPNLTPEQPQQLLKQAQHQQQHQPQQVQRTPSGQPTQPVQQHLQQAQQVQKPPTPHTPVQQVQKPPTPVAPVAPVQKPPTPQMQKAQTPQMQKAQTPQMQKAQTPQMQKAQTPQMQKAQTPQMQKAQTPQTQQQAQAQPQAQQQAQQAAQQAQQQRQASGSATPSATPAT